MSRLALGTVVEIVARGPDRTELREAVEAGFEELGRLETLLSEWRETSDVSALTRGAGGELVSIAPETEAVLRLAREIAAASGGAFDPTVLPLVRLYGFLGGPERIPSDGEILDVLGRVGWQGIEVRAGAARLARPGMEIGLGAIAKGYIADRVLDLLRQRGVAAALVNAGGDVAAFDPEGKGFAVQLESPGRPGEVFAETDLREGGLASSAATYRAFERDGRRISHVLDPRTGRPTEAALSATVVAPSAAAADAWATACLVLGGAARTMIEARSDLEAVLVEPDGTVWTSSGLRPRIRWLLDGGEPGLVEREEEQDPNARVEGERPAELEPREAGGEVAHEPG